MNKHIKKNPAIRLINQYTDEYSLLLSQKKDLEQENNDLKANLKISKDIIQGFFKKEQKDKSKLFLQKTKEEIALLTNSLNHYMTENKDLKLKIYSYETSFNNYLDQYYDKTDDLTNKIFLLENIIKKKEAIICRLRIKLSNVLENRIIEEDEGKEIYIADPNINLLVMQENIKEYQSELKKTIKTINDQFLTIHKLESKIADGTRKTNDSKYQSINYASTHYSSENDTNNHNDINEELIEILKTLQLPFKNMNENIDEGLYDKLKLTFDYVNKIIYEKSLTIKSLSKECDNMKTMNQLLQREKMQLDQMVLCLKNDIKTMKILEMSKIDNTNNNIKETIEESIIKEAKYFKTNCAKYLQEYEKSTIPLNDSFGDELKRSKLFSVFNYNLNENNNTSIIKKLSQTIHFDNDNETTVINMKNNNGVIESFISNADMFEFKPSAL